MKSIFTLLVFTLVTVSEKTIRRREKSSINIETQAPGALTDEIRRYDIEDLILS